MYDEGAAALAERDASVCSFSANPQHVGPLESQRRTLYDNASITCLAHQPLNERYLELSLCSEATK